MSQKKTTAGGAVAGGDCVTASLPKKQQESAPVCWEQFRAFLTEIGRDQGALVVALFPPEQGPCIHVPCAAERLPTADIEQKLKAKAADGLALGLVLNHPLPQPADWGTKPEHLNSAGKPRKWGASDKHISHAIGIWTECDGGLPLEAQEALPKLAGLPEPSLRVWSGSKSLHMYWLLAPGEVLEPDLFKTLQQRLAARLAGVAPEAKPDTSISNAARVMRVPGGLHPKTGERCKIHSCTGKRFTRAGLLEMFPAPEPKPQSTAPESAVGDSIPLERLLCRELANLAAHGTTQGSRNSDAFRLAAGALAVADAAATSGLRVDGTPESVVLTFAARCSPPLTETEALACLQSAQSQPRKTDSGWPERLRFHLNRNTREHRRLQHQEAAAAPPAATQRRRPIPMDEVKDRLREAITEGRGEAELAVLVAELSTTSEHSPINVQRLADAIRAEVRQAAEVHTEAATLAAEADRQEIGQQLTARYLLPPTIAAAIETRARYLPCDGPSAVLPFLAAVAGLVKLGTQVEGSAVAGYRVPVNLFACLVGRSGAKKSPIGRLLVEAPLADLIAQQLAENEREREAWADACRDLKKGEPKPPPPLPKRVWVTEYTGEALAAQLQAQETAGLGLLIHRDELSGLFGSLNAYRGGRGADEQQLLELFDGSGLTSLRIVGDRHYKRSQLSIWGTTQPDVLRQLVADGDASGLWARFLFVPLPERAVRLPLATSAAEVAEVEAAAQTLADACGAIYRLPAQTYRLAPDAAERFAHYELNRQRAALGASIGAQSALYGKSAGKVLRLAGVLHLLQIAAGEISNRDPIEPGTIDRASALVDHLDAWALGLHAEVAAGGVGQLMRTVHRTAEAAGGPIRWKEVQNRLTRAQRKETDPAAVNEAMRALAAAGYGEVEAGQRGAHSYRATRPLP